MGREESKSTGSRLTTDHGPPEGGPLRKETDMTYAINMNTASPTATQALYALDKTYVGTEDYLGLAFYWDHEVKYWMRDASTAKRKKIHELLLKAGEEPVSDLGFSNLRYFKTNDTVREIIGRVLKI